MGMNVDQDVATPIADDGAIAPSAPAPGLLRYLSIALSAALLMLVMALAGLVIAVPMLTGGVALTVLTQSMEPGLPPGTLIVVAPEPAGDIRIGDVITYQMEPGRPTLVTHRVISKSVDSDGRTSFSTMGDNNAMADPNPVTQGQIRGTLLYSIPLLGYVNNAVSGQSRAIIVPVVACALFLYAGRMMFSGACERRRAVRARNDN